MTGTTWSAPDPETLSRLTSTLRQIYPELGDHSTGIKAQHVCVEIQKGSDERTVMGTALSSFAGDGSFALSDDQVARIVAALQETVCPQPQP
ncbi:hypothetical protein [Kitasatospora sp. NPDC090091]|uniref:hypothetical protein n=1 Tax=Kitasatospora sp. NPDC090091 TaxID=3364081 RepID=UPI00382CA7EA